MRRLVLIAALASLALPAQARADETISLVASGFRPNSVTIAAGERVTWRNDDPGPRRIISDKGLFDSALLQPGEKFSFRFRTDGTFGFRDGSVPDRRGAVVVVPAPQSITIAASARRGREVTLYGRVSNGRAGETVTILRRGKGQDHDNAEAVVTTRAGGRWRAVIRPAPGTMYRARWGRDVYSRRINFSR